MIANLKVSVEKLVQLKVVIVLSKGVVEGLGNPEPPKDEEEAERHEDRVVEVNLHVLKFWKFENHEDRIVEVNLRVLKF